MRTWVHAIRCWLRHPLGDGGDDAKPYRLGILFVHGMGAQERGDTITEMGDAVTEWFRRWMEPLPGVDFKLREAELRGGAGSSAAGHLATPTAHVSIGLIDKRDPSRSQEWCLAESWWADAFRPATFGELATWVIAVGPSVLATQLRGILLRVWRSRPSWSRGEIGSVVLVVMKLLTTPVLAIVAVVLAALLTPLAILLFVLSLVPVPGVSDLARSASRNLAGSFGDLLVLVRSPVRFAAMAERVKQDVERLDRLCDRVVIVAHSQGSAVSWHAIRRLAEEPEEKRPQLARFVTFGQAFRKLKALYRLNRVGGGAQAAATILALVSTVSLAAAVWFGGALVAEFIEAQGDLFNLDLADQTVALVGLAVALVVILVVQLVLAAIVGDNDNAAADEIKGELRTVQAALGTDFQWLDLWASADPAPNGPLFDELPPGVDSYKVRNLASTVIDHSVYWKNVTEFVSAVAMAASSLVTPNPAGIGEPVPPELREAARRRDRRVSQLLAARLVFFTALVIGIYAVRARLAEWGAAVLSVAPGLPDWLSWLNDFHGWIAGGLIAVGGLVAWAVIGALWGIPVRFDDAAFFSRRASLMPDVVARLWLLVAVAIPTLAMAVMSIGGLMDVELLVTYLVVAPALVAIAWFVLQPGGRALGEPP